MENASNAARPPGTIVGSRFQIQRLLGEGGMGAVYEARVMPSGESVALKILHEEMSSNPQVVERFLEEGRMCQDLNHPGIMRVLDIGSDQGAPFLVMELLKGRALIDYTEHGQALPAHFAVTVTAGVLHALEHAHNKSIIHRDLKPENVFLCGTDGGQYHTKLLDFGIAKSIDAAGGGRRRTATGVLLGTPGYMSPEQVKAAKNVDRRTDLWAVGVMFYEMVTGRSAFPSDGDDPNNIWGLISAVLTKDPIPLVQIDPQLAPYDAFIKHALAKDPDQRYSSAREMSDDLMAIARGEARPNLARPLNSRGELSMIPPLAATNYAPPPNQAPVQSANAQSLQAAQTLMPGDALIPAGNRTMPTGGADAAAILGGTVPMAPDNSRQSVQPYPTGAGVMPLQSGGHDLMRTALAPPTPSVTPPIAQIPGVRHGTSPSGFGPAPAVSSSPPIIPAAQNRDDEGGGGGGALGWIALAVLLLGGLGAAVWWMVK